VDPDIVIDAQGDVHVVYRTNSYGLYYSTNASGSWQHTPLDQTKKHIDVKIALDSNDYPHVMTASITGQYNNYRHVNYYSHDGSSWNGGSITSEINLQQPRPDFFIDDNDVISMVYHNGFGANLMTETGSITYGYSISPDLPTGLTFSPSSGTISGTAHVLLNRTMFTITATNSGGSSTDFINITVVDRLPTVAYSPDALNLTNNTASPDLPLAPTVTGSGTIISWELNNTNLPSGILFGSDNGTFYGTPTELWPTTAYKVWANNSGGSVAAYLNITVVDELPTLSYNPSYLDLDLPIIGVIAIGNGTAPPPPLNSVLPLEPTLSGAGVITSWEIDINLPNGLFFGANNGTFYGSPLALQTTPLQFTVWANNSGGSVSTQMSVSVKAIAPTIDYTPENQTITNNSLMNPMIPSIGGGEIETWEINATLPNGITFDSSNGSLYGTPVELWPTTSYTIWANNSGGSISATINLTVIDEVPTDFVYSPHNLTLTNNTASPNLPLIPHLTGPGEIIGWEISEELPQGLTFDNNTGEISGIPTVLQLTPMPYTIWANNTGGSISTIINITIIEVEPTLEYNPDDYNFTRGVQISDITPIYSPLNLIDTWEISPGVPLGLIFENGIISGTPTVNMTRTEFTVWANNTGGSASATFNITIVEPTGSFAYVPPSINMTRGQGISPIYPNYNGGAIESWSIYPDVPAGLIFDNGTITGTPTVNSTEVNYTVFANNSGGSVSAIISIIINEPVASIHYAPNERNETRTISMTPWFPQVTGGEVETWEIYPDLPLGLAFVDGVISGVATVNSTTTNYTVWANNSGGSASTNIYLTVVEPVVELSYNNYELILVRNVTMSPLMPQLTGGEVETWEVYPDLPNGINFTDGMIWGTPEVNSTRTMYTVWANNTGGSTNVSLNITILEPSANIVYNPTNLILTRGQAMDPAIPEVDGGAIESWEITPDLPDGLIFDNGTISGTPTVNMTLSTFLIYGNNSGGSALVGISMTILEPAPTITYQTDYLILTRGEEMPSALHAIFGGGAVASFNVEPELPDGLNFTNGTIFGTPTVNSSLVQYNITAINNGGSDYFLLNITILEPVAILDVETNYFELTRSENEMNLTFNNTGGMVATWEVYPDLPDGLVIGNGTITGVPTVNSSLATYEIFANNTGGSASILINIRILEPAANISYTTTQFTLTNGQDILKVSPVLLGGNPDTWEFEPELPDGITFSNGVFSGVPAENLSTTTYTVWANNSGGFSVATIELTINQPFYVVRYPVTILVLNASEDMPVLAPVYYFDETNDPVWAVSPALPDGLIFQNGNIFGTPTMSQPLTQYNVTVTGDMVPFTIVLMIEIMSDKVNITIPDNRNQTALEQGPPETIFPEPEEEKIAYWLFPLFLIILLWLTAMIYNARKADDEVETVGGPESKQKSD
jgi:hypothetical protein